MDLYESNTHSFNIKIWLEETVEETGHVTWRGHITHLLTGKRQSLKDLDDILTFIVPYLNKMGIKFGPGWRVRQWLKRLKLAIKSPG